MDYEKKYNEALEQAKGYMDAGSSDLTDVLPEIFPELRESEDERIRKWIVELLHKLHYNETAQPMALKAIEWLEKQKDASKAIEAVERIDKYIDEHVANAHDMRNSNPDKKYYRGWDDALGKMAGILQDVYSNEKQKEQKGLDVTDFCQPIHPDIAKVLPDVINELTWGDDEQKEQKPLSTEDMPYVTDEHFFEREQADSFKYRLAEYMTKNCKKEESPYGYTYKINSETILEMAKEELIKRGIVVEREQCCMGIKGDPDPAGVWKPTEEQMKAIDFARRVVFETYPSLHNGCEPYHILGELYEQLKKL